MKVRYGPGPRREAAREDGLQLPLTPAKRPRRPYWQWYLMLALAALPVLAGLLWLVRALACSS